ncbi:MAG: hypothetical protein LKI24_07310 [Acidipropionibacterium sp.]|nr:hypothetical protein [Acidipropionibacterium sp.]
MIQDDKVADAGQTLLLKGHLVDIGHTACMAHVDRVAMMSMSTCRSMVPGQCCCR